MSLIIKGATMPDGCEGCRFCTYDISGNAYGCSAKLLPLERENGQSLPKWCPLVEVPDHAVIWGTKADGIPVIMLIQPESKEGKDERTD